MSRHDVAASFLLRRSSVKDLKTVCSCQSFYEEPKMKKQSILILGMMLLLGTRYVEAGTGTTPDNPYKDYMELVLIFTPIVTFIMVVAAGIKKARDNVVVFFSNYFDVFVTFAVVILFFLLLMAHNESSIKHTRLLLIVNVVVIVLYNYTCAFYYNPKHKFLAFCVGTGRVVLGFLLPLFILSFISSFLSPKKEEQSTAEFLVGKAVSAVLLVCTIELLKSLVNKDDVSSYSEPDYNSCRVGDGGAGYVRDPYEVLGVLKTASQEEIHAAYRKQASMYHPDKVAHLGLELQKVAEWKMQEINKAYEQIT
jgi:DnaJ-domain-containing protein 1